MTWSANYVQQRNLHPVILHVFVSQTRSVSESAVSTRQQLQLPLLTLAETDFDQSQKTLNPACKCSNELQATLGSMPSSTCILQKVGACTWEDAQIRTPGQTRPMTRLPVLVHVDICSQAVCTQIAGQPQLFIKQCQCWCLMVSMWW